MYPNRIELNNPYVRFPWGFCGCGSWNADAVLAHPFDRGAFGFRKVKYGVINYLCLIWPVYGDAVARQRYLYAILHSIWRLTHPLSDALCRCDASAFCDVTPTATTKQNLWNTLPQQFGRHSR